MALTMQELNRATLARQLLLERADVDVEAAVRRVVAIQAQEPASPYISLWARVVDLDPAAVDAAIADARLVKATLMRVTLHVVHADDHATVHAAMQPTLRGARLNDRRFTDAGHTAADADEVVPALLAWASTGRSNQEAEAWLGEQRGADSRWLWWALRHCAPLRHEPTGGPWSFGARPSYVAAGGPTPELGDRAAADVALGTLVERYLAGFGPATVADMAQFMLVQRGRLRPVVEGLGERLECLDGPGRAPLYDVPGGERPSADTPAPPRLLPMWDSILFAHHDRTRVVDDDVRAQVIRRNGDTLPSVLVDGRVVGVWRPVDDGIEVTALRRLADDAWEGLAREASSLRALLVERDPDVHGRYRRWWERLEPVDVRVL